VRDPDHAIKENEEVTADENRRHGDRGSVKEYAGHATTKGGER